MHLNDENINTLIERYYSGDKISDLIKEYEIDCRSSHLYKLFPALITNVICEHCGSFMIQEYVSKSSCYEAKEECPICGHKNIDNCTCKKCNEERIRKRAEYDTLRRNEVLKTYDIANVQAYDFDKLSLRDKLLLSSIVRRAGAANKKFIEPIGENKNIVPDEMELVEILKYFHRENIITVSHLSPLDAFTEENFPNTYYIFKVSYYVNLLSEEKNYDQITDWLLSPEISIKDNQEELLEIWKNIALEECKVYLTKSMQKVGLNFSAGQKTEAVLKEALKTFSSGQVFSIIYSCINNSLRAYEEGKVAKYIAANSVVGKIQRYCERAIAEEWSIKTFTRPYEHEQSAYSQLVYDRVLKIGTKGFEKIPSKVIFYDRDEVN